MMDYLMVGKKVESKVGLSDMPMVAYLVGVMADLMVGRMVASMVVSMVASMVERMVVLKAICLDKMLVDYWVDMMDVL